MKLKEIINLSEEQIMEKITETYGEAVRDLGKNTDTLIFLRADADRIVRTFEDKFNKASEAKKAYAANFPGMNPELTPLEIEQLDAPKQSEYISAKAIVEIQKKLSKIEEEMVKRVINDELSTLSEEELRAELSTRKPTELKKLGSFTEKFRNHHNKNAVGSPNSFTEGPPSIEDMEAHKMYEVVERIRPQIRECQKAINLKFVEAVKSGEQKEFLESMSLDDMETMAMDFVGGAGVVSFDEANIYRDIIIQTIKASESETVTQGGMAVK